MTATMQQESRPAGSDLENEQATAARPGLRDVLSNRNFRWLWFGEAVSLLGDQFYLIALPWLVLQLTGDAFAMGTVLALAGIPRALFMLVGGAITDRFSPRTVMLVSNLVRMAFVALLAALVFGNTITLGMIYVMALIFGLADAFFFPAQSAIVPRIVGKDLLEIANALVQGTLQIASFAGPALAGVLIALLSGGAAQNIAGEAVPDMQGLGVAFAIDALTFLASALTLWVIRLRPLERQTETSQGDNVLRSIRDGLTYVGRDVALRSFFLLIAVANFLIVGPTFVGIPVLADTRLPEGAAAFGILMSAYGGGMLLGTVLAGLLPRPPARIMGVVLGVVWSGMGLALAALGLITATPLAALVSLGMGAANGYVVIQFITWLQRRTPEAMLGRVMSLLMFSSAGLLPVSNALAGGLISLNATALFVVSGLLMTLIVLWTLRNPAVRAMEAGEVAA